MTRPEKKLTPTPELHVEKLISGELSADEARAVTQRLEAEGGLARIEALKGSNDAILKEYSPAQLAASIRLRYDMEKAAKIRKLRMILVPVSGVMAAAVALFMLAVPFSSPQHNGVVKAVPKEGLVDRDWRPKGPPQLHVLRKTIDGQERLVSGEHVKVGDVLQVKFVTEEARSLVIVSVDGRGAITLHYPTSETADTKVKPFSTQESAFAYQLDDAPAYERFFMVWSQTETPVSVAEVKSAISRMKNAETDTPVLRDALQYKDINLKK